MLRRDLYKTSPPATIYAVRRTAVFTVPFEIKREMTKRINPPKREIFS